MSLDDFFKGSKEAWKKEQKRIADEVKAKEEAERKRKIDEIKNRRGKGKAATIAVPPAVIPLIIPAGNFKIESLADRYRIHQVQYQNNLYVVDWSKELLDERKNHTQQEWIAFTQNLEWKIPDMQLYHATLCALYRQRDHPDSAQKSLLKEMHQLFRADFDPDKQYMITSTRIKYAASGLDEVTHGWRYASARKHAVALIGPNKYINAASGLEEEMNVLLGSRDLTEIEKVYEWVCGVKPYLWRFTQAPAQNEERGAVLGSNGNLFIIDCDSDIGSRPSRGVVASQKGQSPFAQKGKLSLLASSSRAEK